MVDSAPAGVQLRATAGQEELDPGPGSLPGVGGPAAEPGQLRGGALCGQHAQQDLWVLSLGQRSLRFCGSRQTLGFAGYGMGGGQRGGNPSGACEGLE